jgi:hypothetical protein
MTTSSVEVHNLLGILCSILIICNLYAELLDVLPSKRKHDDDSDSSGESSGDDQDELDVCTTLLAEY